MRGLIESRLKHAIGVMTIAASVFACSNGDPDIAAEAPKTSAGPLSLSRTVVSQDGLASPAWQTTLTALIAQNNLNPLVAGRAYALLGVAQYRGVQRVGGARGRRDTEATSLDDGSEGARRSHRAATHGAVAGASAVVLSYLFPSLQ